MRFHSEQSGKLLTLLALLFLLTAAASSQTAAADEPVSDVMGRTVYRAELIPPEAGEQKNKMSPGAYASWLAQAQEEKLRALVWGAVFRDYAEKRKIEPTDQRSICRSVGSSSSCKRTGYAAKRTVRA